MSAARALQVKALMATFAVVVLSSCTSGKDAVDQAAGSEQRFVSGSGTTVEYSPADRPAAPKLTGELLDGTDYDLSAQKGKVVVINFWGSWCAPCRAEADDLEAVYAATKASGVEFLGVNVKDSRDNAKAYEQAFQVTYPSIYDRSQRVALKFRDTPPNAIPATIVLDRAGRVAVVLRKPLLREDLQPYVTRIAAEKP
jgi:thiol-disulfide isomerase/thioredoxin